MRKVLLLAVLLFSGFAGFAQVYFQGGAGVTSKASFGGDLAVGYSLNKTTFSAGYFAILDDGEPALFNFQAGYRLTEAIRMYGGYVRKHQSSHLKENNSNSWVAGIEYNTKSFNRGNFYYSANYIPNYVFLTVGMKFNY